MRVMLKIGKMMRVVKVVPSVATPGYLSRSISFPGLAPFRLLGKLGDNLQKGGGVHDPAGNSVFLQGFGIKV